MDIRRCIRALAPNRPLPVGDFRYVERPADGADRLATLALLQSQTLLVNGPTGVGKSTVLRAAAAELASEAVAQVVALDRFIDLSDPSPARIVRTIHHCVMGRRPSVGGGEVRSLNWETDRLLSVLRSARQSAPQDALVLLVDGLEKAPASVGDTVARQLIELGAKLELGEKFGLIVVLPAGALEGGQAAPLMARARAFDVGPVDPDVHMEFFRQLISQRLEGLGEYAALAQFIEGAAFSSGGIPRTFLSLLEGAMIHAVVNSTELKLWDFLAACDDQKDALRRLLSTEQFSRLKNGEVRDEDHVRFVAHGILLPSGLAGERTYRPHPLLVPPEEP